ncbi:phosphoribosylamine--glycine ligase [Myxococcota bacterium]|nr:phosphoribosylamine--glycine ligase [Myxococcota bacterium]
MNNLTVLILGGGGREHALAWALSRSPRVDRVVIAPGNAGTAGLPKCENLAVDVNDPAAVVTIAQEFGVNLAVVGPEAPLAAGVGDALNAAWIPCFGPTRAAARLESSKAFAKDFMARWGIPTARSQTFTDLNEAIAAARSWSGPFVIKASGLAAGKGVTLPETLDEAEADLRRLMAEGALGGAGREVVIEDRLEGVEVSVLAFCDGATARLMPAAQDHKRLLDGDLGPNTGGMGAYAPAPFVDDNTRAFVLDEILRKTLDGMRAERNAFVGVLYAGLMLTADGPKVLEFNARFGDPEAQAILPLLETDLAEIFLAAVSGTLHEQEIVWRDGASAAVVLASEGYPERQAPPRPLGGLDDAAATGALVFHAGTKAVGAEVLATGGRVLSVVGVGDSLAEALGLAYAGVEKLKLDGGQHRRDIGARGLSAPALPQTAQRAEGPEAAEPPAEEANATSGVTYRDAGVDIEEGNRAVRLMKQAVEASHGPDVIGGLGSFGGLFSTRSFRGMEEPVLVGSTDGVGTKTRVAVTMGVYDTVGEDLVNHCVNDILVQGAKPLFFLDYFAASKLHAAQVAAVVGGAARACKAVGAALLGGETAEMPGVYHDGEFDLAGTIVGVVDRPKLILGDRITPGDAVLAMPSSGLHTNGYSLARKVLARHDWRAEEPRLGGRSIGEALLAPHRAYLNEVNRLRDGLGDTAAVDVKGLAHITGGGLIENPPRILPAACAFELQSDSWALPPLFQMIQEAGRISTYELRRAFNCGVGMLIVVPEDEAERALALLATEGLCGGWRIGRIVPRGKKPPVRFV